MNTKKWSLNNLLHSSNIKIHTIFYFFFYILYIFCKSDIIRILYKYLVYFFSFIIKVILYA